MFSALFWKHVRQVRSLFWQAAALVVVALFLGVSFCAGNIQLGGDAAAYKQWDSIVSAVLLLMVLPLAAIAFAVRIVAGDDEDGTESFLAARPVRPLTRIAARVAAALTLSLALACASTLVLAPFVRDLTKIGELAFLFAGLALNASTCALAAVIAGARGVRAVILGWALMFGLNLGVMWLADLFEPVKRWAAVWSVLAPFGLMLAVLFATRGFGEPAGRGRRARGVAVFVVGVMLIVPTFLYGAAAIARRPPVPAEIAGDVRASSTGQSVVVGASDRNMLRAWLVGVPGGAAQAFFPAPIHAACWTTDGMTLALVTRAGANGTARSKPLVRFLSGTGGETRPPVELWDEGTNPIEAYWAGDRVLLRTFATTDRPDVWVVRSGVPASRFHLADFGAVRLLGAAPDGTAYIAQYDGGKRPSDFASRGERERSDVDPKSPEIHVWLKVFRLRADAREPDATPVLAIPDVSTIPGAAQLSRDGRLFYVLEQGTPKVVDLATGATVPFALHGAVTKVAWLAGNRLLWSEGAPGEARVLVAGAGEEPREVAHGMRWILPEPSPDGRRVLITEVEGVQGGRKPLAYWLYDDAARRWSALDAIGGRDASLATRLWWAGNDTLLRTTKDAIELVPLAEPGKARRIWD